MNSKKLNGTLRSYLKWPLLLCPLLIVMNVHIYMLNLRSGIIMSVYLAIYIVIAFLLLYSKRPTITQDLIRYSMNYNRLQKKFLEEMVIPFAILDVDGHFLWANDEFIDAFPGKNLDNYNVSALIPAVSPTSLPTDALDEEIHFHIEEVYYKAILRRIDLSKELSEIPANELNSLGIGESFISIHLFDETEIVTYIRENREQRLSVGLLYIDNYEESLESVEEVRRSLLTALIDRKVNKYMQSIDAITKKIEKDKYIFVFQHKYLAQLQSDKFSLLNEIRSVNVGNEISVTISMGIGVQAGSYNKRYEYARTAIDLALGRGGDQVVVKTPDNILYYGGKSMQLEKNTRVKARVKAHALKELVEATEKIVIMGHSLPDVDSVGAAIGIYRIAKTLGKTAHIVIGETTVSIKPIIQMLKSQGDYEDNLFITKDTATNIVTQGTLLVVVDVNRPSYTDCPELIDMTNTVVILDHHRQTGESFVNPVLSYIEPFASSACEMVAEILQYVDDGIRLKSYEADAMYSGIMVDTNNFLNKTGVRTFEAVAYLRRNGADITRIRKLFRSDMKEYQIRAQAIQNTEIFMDSYAIASFNADGYESPTIVASKIADELLDVNNIEASFVLTKFNDKVYISARSIDELNVQIIMEKFNGGGHISSAGAQLENCTLEEAASQVKDMLKKMKEEGDL